VKGVHHRLLGLTCAVLILESFLSSVLTPLVPFYRDELGLNEGQTGILVAAYAAGLLLASLPAGWAASIFNPRRAVITGLVGVSVSGIAFGFADDIAFLDISRLFMGGFGALMWAGSVAWMVSATARERRGQVMGVLLAAAVAGELAGSPIGAWAESVGTDRVFIGVLVVALALAGVAFTVPAVSEVDGQGARQALAAVRTFGTSSWVLALLAVISPSIALGMVLLVGPLRLESLGMTAWFVAGTFVTMSVVEMIIGPIAGRVSDHIGRGRPYFVGIAIMAACVILASVIDVTWLLVAVLIAYSIGSALAFTTSMTTVTDLATAAGLNQGYSSALSGMGWAGGLIIGAVLGGMLIGSIGYFWAALLIAVLLLGAGASMRRVGQPAGSPSP
jgi:DHA1 family solute carrier family 18 vesicular amine transporter 1/2